MWLCYLLHILQIMRFLLTGGAGFIGSHLAKYLHLSGHTVTILDIKQPLDGVSDFVVGDVRNIKAWSPFYHPEKKIDYLIHLASVVGVKKVSANRFNTVTSILDGTRNALIFASERNIPVMIFSTSEVYGNAPAPFMEDSSSLVLGQSQYSRWSYASAKLCSEHLTLAFKEEMGVQATIIRPFNVTGAGQTGFVLPNFVSSAIDNRPIWVSGDGSQIRCFISVRDAVEAIALLATTGRGVGEILNLGNPENKISILELAKQIKTLTSSSSEIVCDNKFSYPSEIIERIPNISKIKSLINWSPKRTVDDIISSTASICKQVNAAA